jgi:hypothetical protein
MWHESPGGQSATLWQTWCAFPQSGRQLVPLALVPQHIVPGIDEHPALEVHVTMKPVPPLPEPELLTTLPLDPEEPPLGIPPELPLEPPL